MVVGWVDEDLQRKGREGYRKGTQRRKHFSARLCEREFKLEVQPKSVCRFAPEGRDVYSLEVVYLTHAQ
jgi:hypothetical protein